MNFDLVFSLKFLFFLLISSTVCSGDAPHGSSVISLNSRNFDGRTRKGNWFIKFYAPWCGHCQMLAPVWEEVSGELLEEVEVGEVNCDENRALCSRFDIKYYPTIWYLSSKKTLHLYESGMSADSMALFARKGWRNKDAVPWVQSPYGPSGRVKGFLLFATECVQDCYEYLTVSLRLPVAFVVFMFIVFGILSCLVLILTIEWIYHTATKPKQD